MYEAEWRRSRVAVALHIILRRRAVERSKWEQHAILKLDEDGLSRVVVADRGVDLEAIVEVVPGGGRALMGERILEICSRAEVLLEKVLDYFPSP